MLHQLLVSAAVADEVGDGDKVQFVFGGEHLEIRQSGHGPVVVHDLAQHPDRRPICQGTQVHGRLGVAGPLQHTTGPGP